MCASSLPVPVNYPALNQLFSLKVILELSERLWFDLLWDILFIWDLHEWREPGQKRIFLDSQSSSRHHLECVCQAKVFGGSWRRSSSSVFVRRWLGGGSRFGNNTLIYKKAAQCAEGPNSDIDPDSCAHHRHRPTHISPLLSRGHSLQFWVCPGIIFLPNVLLVPALTAEPKFTASLIRIMGQWAPSVVTCFQNEPGKRLQNVGWNGPEWETNKQTNKG